jgi:hypothetical protein
MSAKASNTYSRGASDLFEGAGALSLRVRCPGLAHRRVRRAGDAGLSAADVVCLVCDPEDDGFIEIMLATVEGEILHRAAQALPVDAKLARRMVRLELLESVGPCHILTAAGHAAIADLPVDAALPVERS